MKIWRHDENGFTLIELLISMAALGLLLAVVISVQQTGLRAYVTNSNNLETQQNARIALERMEREIREASAITAAGTSSITFTAQDGLTVVTYVLGGNTLERSGVPLVGGVETLTFVYRGPSDAPETTPANIRRVDIMIRTRTEETVADGGVGDRKYQSNTSVRLRNIL
jgi:prepilin-type N-terminal cleavage/methylation domain-containing protein